MSDSSAAPKKGCWENYQSKDIVCVVRTLKAMNIFAGLCCVVLYPVVIALDIDDQWEPQKMTLIIYTILFALLLIILELNCFSGFFMKYYGFMYSYFGRTGFMIFLGSLCCLTNHAISFVVASVVVTVAFLNLVVLCTRKEFREGGMYSIWTNPNESSKSFRERATRGALNYARNNPDQMKSVAKAGIDFAKDNPDVVRAGFEAAAKDEADDGAFM